jgi:serine/threonine protein kinase
MAADPTPNGQCRNLRIGRYEVVAHIATGGMGAIYRARDTEIDREVALKMLPPELAARPDRIERFRREARHASKLQHENIVTVYEFGAEKSTFFIAMEFIDGIDLKEYSLRKGPLHPDEALQFILQAGRALDYLYQSGIVHRDIKPSNFLLTRRGDDLQIKLTDLGLARESSNEEFRVTKAGHTVGTVDYMAPEQSQDSSKADIRSDLYSLGGTWYYLLTGQVPLGEGGLMERLLKVLYEEPPDVRQFNPQVSEATVAVLKCLMAKKPQERYQTPAELLHDLEALARGELRLPLRRAVYTQVAEEPPPAPPIKKKRRSRPKDTPPPSRRPLWLGLAGAGVVVLVVGLLAALSLGGRRSSPSTQPSIAKERNRIGEMEVKVPRPSTTKERNIIGEREPGAASSPQP